MKKKKGKYAVILNSKNQYVRKCSIGYSYFLTNSGKAERLNKKTIRLIESKSEKKEHAKEIINEAHRICYICGEHIPLHEIATIDHVVPKSRDNDSNVVTNMQCCCLRCNADKKDMMPIEYLNHILHNRKHYSYLSDERIGYLKKKLPLLQRKFNKNKRRRDSMVKKRKNR